MIFGIGSVEILLIGALVLVLFGPNRMLEMARTFGRATAEVRRTVAEVRTEIDEASRLEKPSPPDGET